MKVLVLENIAQLDYEMGRYLKLEHSNDEIEILYHLEETPKAKLHKELSKADCICVQSLFGNRKQLEQFIGLLNSYENIKEIRIIHGFTTGADPNSLLKILNLGIKDVFADLIKLVETKKVSEIVCRVVDVNSSSDKFFADRYFIETELQYDIVPLYVNYDYFKSGMVWHERQAIPDASTKKFYKKESKKPGRAIHIEPKDLKTFASLMEEVRAFIEYQKESCELSPNDDTDVLIAEKTDWIVLLDKYRLGT